MKLLDKLLGRQGIRREGPPKKNEQAVLIDLRGDGLPQATYDQYDLKGLEEQLADVLDGTSLGELDGHELTSSGVTVYLYGPDAETLFRSIEPVLRSYPLCERAFVTVRQGKPGATYRVVLL